MKKIYYKRGETCPVCLKEVVSSQRAELNLKTGVITHSHCAIITPMQDKAIKELDKVMANIKLKENSFGSMKIRGI